MEKLDILDILLDKENKDPIHVIDNGGRELTFEQVAVIPQGKTLYCILKPLEAIPGVADDEAIVFKVCEGIDNTTLRVEDDEEIAVGIFAEYYRLLEKAWKNK